jgi:hypothetical protein
MYLPPVSFMGPATKLAVGDLFDALFLGFSFVIVPTLVAGVGLHRHRVAGHPKADVFRDPSGIVTGLGGGCR